MRTLRGWLLRLVGVFMKARSEHDITDEIGANLEAHVRANVDAGMSPEEARRQALIRLGGVEATKERWRDQRSIPVLESFFRDIAYAVRTLRHSKGFAAVAILTLSLGIGANTAIFSAVNGVLLEPLPYAEPSRLVQVWGFHPEIGTEAMSLPDFHDWRERSTSFEDMAGYFSHGANLTAEGEAERVTTARVTGGFFRTFGVPPAHGRTISLSDDFPGAPRIAVLSHSFWRQRYGSNPAIIGQVLVLDGVPVEIIGVAAEGFEFPSGVSMWQPTSLDRSAFGRRSNFLRGIARLRRDADLRSAQIEIATIAAGLEQEYPNTNASWTARLVPLHDELVGAVRPALFTLLAAVGLVLLIACTNVANLVLSRAAGREAEIAMRSALGASRRRIVSQLLAEAALLGLLGVVGGVVLASGMLRLVLPLGLDQLPRFENIMINGTVLAYTAILTLLTGVLFGVVPALNLSRVGITRAIGDRTRTVAGSRSKLRSLLVVSEVALATILLVGSALLLQSFAHLSAVDPGHAAEGIVSFRVTAPESSYSDHAQVIAFYDRLQQRLTTLPGIEIVALAQWLPPEAAGSYLSFRVEGQEPLRAGLIQDANINLVDHEYFDALQIPIVDGRGFESKDRGASPPVAVISETMANRYWPGQSALGERIAFGEDYMTIVGIAGDVKNTGLSQPSYPLVYRLHSDDGERGMTVVLPIGSTAPGLLPMVRSAVSEIDPGIPVYSFDTIQNMMSRQRAESRFTSILIASLGLVSLLLAVIGLYGVTAHAVSEKMREIGIRIALGAMPRSVVGHFTSRVILLTLLGSAIGLTVAAGLSGLLSSLLFGIPGRDPITYAVVACVLIVSASAATILPVTRASRMDPLLALRKDA